MSGCGLHNRAIEVRFPAETRGFFSLASVSRPALWPTLSPVQWVPGVLSPGLKRGWGVTLTIHPHLVPRSRMSRSYTSSPTSAFIACSGTVLEVKSTFEITGQYSPCEELKPLTRRVCVCVCVLGGRWMLRHTQAESLVAMDVGTSPLGHCRLRFSGGTHRAALRSLHTWLII
jgi:hypothetical protein